MEIAWLQTKMNKAKQKLTLILKVWLETQAS